MSKIFFLDFIFGEVKVWKLISYVIILSLCFVFFQQGDLIHTIISSNAYLYGHFKDFYDYNLHVVGGNDYFPLLYIIFAIWNLPLKFLHLISSINVSAIELYWSKLLLLILFFIVSKIIYKITIIITNDDQQSSVTAILFATAPIAIFSVFIFGQYDIIGLTFTMIGYYYYLQKNLSKFAWFFSLAVSCKFFPVFIFLPLLLLSEKKIVYILKYTLMVLSASALQILLYWNNTSFRTHTLFSLAGGKLVALGELSISTVNHAPYLYILYTIICMYAYIKDPEDEFSRYKSSIFVAIAVYGSLFSTVVWHPQWLVIVMPFFALSTVYIRDKAKFYLIELLGMIAYIILVVNFFPENVDVTMLKSTPFGKYFPELIIHNRDIFGHGLLPIAMSLFYIYLFSPLLILIFQEVSKTIEKQIKNFGIYFDSRFYIGLGFFIIPSLLCLWSPPNVIALVFPNKYMQHKLSLLQVNIIGDVPFDDVGEIISGSKVSQSFLASHDELHAISVLMATYARKNSSKIKFTLLNQDHKKIYSQELGTGTISDNTYLNFIFPVISKSKGNVFYFELSSVDASAGNAITVYRTKTKNYSDGILLVNKTLVAGDLVMKIYYNKPV